MTTPDKTIHRCGLDLRPDPAHHRWVLLQKRQGKPPGQRALHQGSHALGPGQVHALLEQGLGFLGQDWCCVTKGQAQQPVRMVQPQALPDHAANGKSHKMCALNRQGIQQSDHILPQHLQRVGAPANLTFAMAAHVIAHYAKIWFQHRKLRFPHHHARTKGVAQHHHGCIWFAAQFTVNLNPVGFNQHIMLLPGLCFNSFPMLITRSLVKPRLS